MLQPDGFHGQLLRIERVFARNQDPAEPWPQTEDLTVVGIFDMAIFIMQDIYYQLYDHMQQ